MGPPNAQTIFSLSGQSPIPFVSIAGYDIVREIGRGGQAVVYQAVYQTTGRIVAVKVTRDGPWADDASKARFDREAQALAALKHPGIVGVHDQGLTADGSRYLAMDYVAGLPLDQYMNQPAAASASIRAIMDLFLKFADIINTAHSHGVIHRDLKPSNVLVDAEDNPHVVDFGLARSAGSSEISKVSSPVSCIGQFVGSLPWASPEQVETIPGKVDASSDVYALGMILYYMLTGGCFPYAIDGSEREIMNRIVGSRAVPPSSAIASAQTAKWRKSRRIDRSLDAIVLKALAKRPEDRYGSVADLATDIRSHLAGIPIAACQTTRWRNVGRFGACAAILLAAAIAVAVFTRARRHAGTSQPAPLSSARPIEFSMPEGRIVAVVGGTGFKIGQETLNAITQFRAEFQVRTKSQCDAMLLTKKGSHGEASLMVLLRRDGAVAVAGDTPKYRVMLNGHRSINDGQWHRIRVEKYGRRVELHVDGIYEGEMITLMDFASPSAWRLGGGLPGTWLQASVDAEFKDLRMLANVQPPLSRLVELRTPSKEPAGSRRVNLLSLIDPDRDAVAGKWTRKADGALFSDGSSVARVRIPYRPPEEYDFRVEFTRLGGDQAVVQSLSGFGHFFAWHIGGFDGTTCGFSRVAGANLGWAGNPTACLSAAKWVNGSERCTSVVQVRRDGVRAFLGDKLVCQWPTDYRDLTVDEEWKIPDSFLGLGSNSSPTVFHQAVVVEVNGKGEILDRKLAQ
jgi:tRNA A-37 threonylcarbamoyl transferase component Bud32